MKKYYKILCILLFISVLLNVAIFLPYIKPLYLKIINYLSPVEYFSKKESDTKVLLSVSNAILTNKGRSVIMPMNEQRGLIQDLKTFFKPTRNNSINNNYYTSYALVGASYYALMNNDYMMMKELSEIANSFLTSDGKLNYEIQRIDQIPIGILYINLYKYYKKLKYKYISDGIYEKVKSMRNNDGIIYYINSHTCQFSDVLGMYVPFLMEYFTLSKDSVAYEIVNYNIRQFYKYGVNKETGIPFHGYNIKNKVPVGSSNWGRGIGWYLLALAYFPSFNDSILDSTIKSLNYSQFPCSDRRFDSSTAIMFEIYKQARDNNRCLSLDFIKPHIRINGFVDGCSGDTYNLNDYSHIFGESELCNGLLLILASKFSNLSYKKIK